MTPLFHLTRHGHRPLRPSRLRVLAAGGVMALGAMWALASLPAQASDHADHEQARAALKRGEIRPLTDLMARLQRERPGDVLEVELERSRGRWVYEIKQLEAGGQIVKIRLDALSGDIIDLKAGRHSRADRPSHD